MLVSGVSGKRRQRGRRVSGEFREAGASRPRGLSRSFENVGVNISLFKI